VKEDLGAQPPEGAGGEPEDQLPRMSFLEHLEELRRRLIHAFVALILGFLVCWGFSEHILEWLLRPALPPGEVPIVLVPTEGFFTHLRVAFLAGIFLSFPYIICQLWLFIAPGLYRHEKRLAVPFILFLTLFFLGGGLFGYAVGLPRITEFLARYMEGMDPQLSVRSLVTFVSRILLGLGIVFELPILIFFLARLGLVTPAFLWRHMRHATLIIFVVAAALTPTGDVATLLVFAVPMILLYLLGIGVAWAFGKPRQPPDVEEEL
jgi:sec-independent protein translocase protein TatC